MADMSLPLPLPLPLPLRSYSAGYASPRTSQQRSDNYSRQLLGSYRAGCEAACLRVGRDLLQRCAANGALGIGMNRMNHESMPEFMTDQATRVALSSVDR